MPTQTFFNLPEVKRVRLMSAARAELARVPFAEASINRIVRSAEISRGSFYQYFASKQDMLDYLLADYQETLAKNVEKSLKNSGGDLFQMLLDILDNIYIIAADMDAGGLIQNLFSDIRINSVFLERQDGDEPFGVSIKELRRLVDTSALDIRCEQDFEDMLGVLLPLTGEAFAQIFFEPTAYQERRSRFAARLELVKRGFLKEKVSGQCSDTSP